MVIGITSKMTRRGTIHGYCTVRYILTASGAIIGVTGIAAGNTACAAVTFARAIGNRTFFTACAAVVDVIVQIHAGTCTKIGVTGIVTIITACA